MSNLRATDPGDDPLRGLLWVEVDRSHGEDTSP